jgi:hypothetical protein
VAGDDLNAFRRQEGDDLTDGLPIGAGERLLVIHAARV